MGAKRKLTDLTGGTPLVREWQYVLGVRSIAGFGAELLELTL
jgi:hypothetical protein